MNTLGYLIIALALPFIHGADDTCQDSTSAWGWFPCRFTNCSTMMSDCPYRCQENSYVFDTCCSSCTKKQQGITLIAEILISVDPKGVERYMSFGYSREGAKNKLEKDMDFFFGKANEIYETLDKPGGVRLRIAPAFIDFMTRDIFVDGNVKMSAEPMLDAYARYINAMKRTSSRQFDAAMMFTGHDPPGVHGIAYVRNVCQRINAVGLSQLLATGKTFGTLAHELGHLFGSNHDTGDCIQGHALMERTAKQPTHFSTCSRKSIKTNIDRLNYYGDNCLMPARTSISAASFKGHLTTPIEMLDPIAMCKRRYGYTATRLCISKATMRPFHGDLFCQAQYCRVRVYGGSHDCFRIEILDGTACDDGKVCRLTKCIAGKQRFKRPIRKRDLHSLYAYVPEGTKYYDEEADMPNFDMIENE